MRKGLDHQTSLLNHCEALRSQWHHDLDCLITLCSAVCWVDFWLTWSGGVGPSIFHPFEEALRQCHCACFACYTKKWTIIGSLLCQEYYQQHKTGCQLAVNGQLLLFRSLGWRCLFHLAMIVDCDHEDTVADMECIHIFLKGSNSICPENMRPGFVTQSGFEPCIQTLQEAYFDPITIVHVQCNYCFMNTATTCRRLRIRQSKWWGEVLSEYFCNVVLMSRESSSKMWQSLQRLTYISGWHLKFRM